MPDPVITAGFNTPFAEQLAFFRQKLNLPTERWDDIHRAAHDRAFIVAGAMQADLLTDLRAAVDRSIADGKSIGWFRDNFNAIVAKHGWHGWTGEGSQAGEAWRTRVIYQTNLSTSYAAGRYRQLTDPAFLEKYPYWRWKHVPCANPRHSHLAWNGLTLPHDHKFWRLHFPPQIPPNWGCRCKVFSASAREYEQSAKAGLTEPPEGFEAADGAEAKAQLIDAGWSFAPGANTHRSLKEFIDAKLIKLDAPIGASMYEAMRPVLAAEQKAAVQAMVDKAISTKQAGGNAALAHVVAPKTVADIARRSIPLQSADIWLRDEELLHALRDTKADRGAVLPESVWRNLPDLLAEATPYLDAVDTALIYVFDTPDGLGKIAVRVNFTDKIRVGGKRDKLTSNFIRTGGMIEVKNIESDARYVRLEK